MVVVEQPEGQSCAAIGGIMALRMKTRGAIGCVVGGRVRDLGELNNCGLPVSAPMTTNNIQTESIRTGFGCTRPQDPLPGLPV